MFVKFSKRTRPYTPGWAGVAAREPHRTVIAQLVESRRVDSQPRQHIVAHLGTCREPIGEPAHRQQFYERCSWVLDDLDLSEDERAKIEEQLAARIPPLTPQEQAALQLARATAAARYRPDGFAALVAAWEGASEDERGRFLDELQQRGVLRPGR